MLYSVDAMMGNSSAFPLFLQVFSINYEQEPISRPQGTPLFQWFYCVKGKGEIIIDHQRSVVNEGQGFFIASMVSHQYRGLTDTWVLHSIGIGGAVSADTFLTLGMTESGVYNFSDPSIFPDHMKEIHQIYRSRQKNKDLAFSKECYDFLLDLSRCIHRINSTLPTNENSTIQSIITYIENHYQESISLDDIASHVELTREYICSLFKKEMHQTIVSYITGTRISRARILLCQYPEKKVLEIAKMCGFESPSYFGMVFKKEMGITPEQFRNRN